MKVTFENSTTTVIKTFSVEYVQDVDIVNVYNDFVKINELKQNIHIKETDFMESDILVSDADFTTKIKMDTPTHMPKLPDFVDEEIEECTALPSPPDMNIDELDSMGVKWDPKIHAKAKTKNKNGTWRLGNNRELPSAPAIP